MTKIFKPGDQKQLKFIVGKNDVASFATGTVHEVYSTFALARDAEWTTRQFVLEMKEIDEEGIGTMISVQHHAPAFVGEEVIITGSIKEIQHHEIVCTFEVKTEARLIASGITGQKILTRKKFEKLFSSLRKQSEP